MTLTNVGLARVAVNDASNKVGLWLFNGAYCHIGGADHHRLLVGMVWDDLDADVEYDAEEGLGGVNVDPGVSQHYVTIGVAGGNAIPMTRAGVVRLRFSGDNHAHAKRLCVK